MSTALFQLREFQFIAAAVINVAKIRIVVDRTNQRQQRTVKAPLPLQRPCIYRATFFPLVAIHSKISY